MFTSLRLDVYTSGAPTERADMCGMKGISHSCSTSNNHTRKKMKIRVCIYIYIYISPY